MADATLAFGFSPYSLLLFNLILYHFTTYSSTTLLLSTFPLTPLLLYYLLLYSLLLTPLLLTTYSFTPYYLLLYSLLLTPLLLTTFPFKSSFIFKQCEAPSSPFYYSPLPEQVSPLNRSAWPALATASLTATGFRTPQPNLIQPNCKHYWVKIITCATLGTRVQPSFRADIAPIYSKKPTKTHWLSNPI